MRLILAMATCLAATCALADEPLNFNIDKLCLWQLENNSMALDECHSLENEGKAWVDANEKSATAERKQACVKETLSYAGDSGYSSYTVYSTCLKDGPGLL